MSSMLDRVRDRGVHRPTEKVTVVFPAIPKHTDPVTGEVIEEVPELREVWTVCGMTAMERDEFETSMQQPVLQSNGKTRTKAPASGAPNTRNFRGRFLARCIWDGGKRPFLGPEGEQVLGDQPAMVLEDLIKVAMRLNGMTKEDAEELEGNLEETAEEDSSSSSHELFTEQSMN